MFDLTDKRAMNRGFGDGMSRAFELIATPAVFGAIGYLIDRVAGTAPVFTVVLASLAIVGMFLRVWYGYDTEMRQHETSARWAAGADRTRSVDTDVDLWSTRGARRLEADR